MDITQIAISREESVIQVGNWPSVENNNGAAIENNCDAAQLVSNLAEANVAILNNGPVCENGLCQLGSWKPRKIA
ncbi:MAG: hypothetical protein KGS72_15910 [Cyanobacteria bacterium REEB67]|nr:hypothetical protein [Cyanobacteria bacterium REEB67]